MWNITSCYQVFSCYHQCYHQLIRKIALSLKKISVLIISLDFKLHISHTKNLSKAKECCPPAEESVLWYKLLSQVNTCRRVRKFLHVSRKLVRLAWISCAPEVILRQHLHVIVLTCQNTRPNFGTAASLIAISNYAHQLNSFVTFKLISTVLQMFQRFLE